MRWDILLGVKSEYLCCVQSEAMRAEDGVCKLDQWEIWTRCMTNKYKIIKILCSHNKYLKKMTREKRGKRERKNERKKKKEKCNDIGEERHRKKMKNYYMLTYLWDEENSERGAHSCHRKKERKKCTHEFPISFFLSSIAIIMRLYVFCFQSESLSCFAHGRKLIERKEKFNFLLL